MKILLIHQYFQEKDGAGGTRFNEMTKTWKHLGHETTVITGNLSQRGKVRREEYRGKFVTKVFQDDIEVWRCFVSKSYNKSFLGRFWGYVSFVISGVYAGVFKVKGHYDVILVTSPPLFVGIIAYLISIVKKRPFIFEVRDLWPESAIDTGVIRNRTIIRFSYWFESFIYRKAMLINVLTPAFYRNISEKKGIPESKLIMIPNAADFSLADELLFNFNASQFRIDKGIEDKFVIVYMGAHGRANGLHQLLETANRLKETNVLFLLIGDGMEKKNLISTARDMGLTNVQFIDPMPKREVMKYVLSSDMGASVLIKNDTFKTIYSNKTFDYMSCKKPILMAIDGVSRKLLEEADAGVFIEPENSEDFEKNIRYYLLNNLELKRQGENGYNYAKENFDREKLAIKYIKLISENIFMSINR
jgi:glycosyltransferase involved in cell wall biosynthesis